jgi:hypothetical protein
MDMPPEKHDFVDFLRDGHILDEGDAQTIQNETRDFKEAAAQIALKFGMLSHEQLDQVLNANKDGAGFEETALHLEILSEREVELLGQVDELRRAVEVCVALILGQKMSVEAAAAQLQAFFIQNAKCETKDESSSRRKP